MKKTIQTIGLTALTLLTVAGCSKTGESAGEERSDSNIDLRVAALNLAGVNGVVYGVTVKNAGGDVIWTRNNLDSVQFGDGVGAISYVGPCDASEGANPHRIELTLLEMRTGPGQVIPPSQYRNPAPPDNPVVATANCVENADVPVVINLTIMRNAQQGFFDIGVTFDDIFCSAKFDCRRNGNPFTFLHNEEGVRDYTVILGFACTSGGDGQGGGQSTWLHLTEVVVQCLDGLANDAPVTLMLDPSGPEGNNGPAAPLFFQTGIYRGQEQLEPYDKCYWNMAFGIRLPKDDTNNENPTNLHSCRLRARGTASQDSFAPTGATPSETIYPYIEWDIALTDDQGELACGVHPLNGTDTGYPTSSVSTQYTEWSGTSFTYEWECDDDTTITTNALACAGELVSGTAPSATTSTEFVPQVNGLTVKFDNSMSTFYELPDGYAFGPETYCCVNPCCAQ
jgi:hypothetical protein